VLPSDREKGEFYDIVLGVSTRNLSVEAIESIHIRIEQSRASYESFECEVSCIFSISLYSHSPETCVIIPF
jgi:hypothetical protein